MGTVLHHADTDEDRHGDAAAANGGLTIEQEDRWCELQIFKRDAAAQCYRRSTGRTFDQSDATVTLPLEIEQALAHTVPDAVERAYKPTPLFDKRRQLMALWSKFCASSPKAAADNVVAIRERA
jgi:hypothetical protein